MLFVFPQTCKLVRGYWQIINKLHSHSSWCVYFHLWSFSLECQWQVMTSGWGKPNVCKVRQWNEVADALTKDSQVWARLYLSTVKVYKNFQKLNLRHQYLSQLHPSSNMTLSMALVIVVFLKMTTASFDYCTLGADNTLCRYKVIEHHKYFINLRNWFLTLLSYITADFGRKCLC